MPTLDLTDSSIAKVELKFDMWHRYHGSYANFYGNNFQDNVEVLAALGADPSQFGEYSEEIIGKGVTISNSILTTQQLVLTSWVTQLLVSTTWQSTNLRICGKNFWC